MTNTNEFPLDSFMTNIFFSIHFEIVNISIYLLNNTKRYYIMILSQTSKYALRILAHMAESSDRLYTAKSLFEELEIPQRYLGRLLTQLSKSGFIASTQGRHGGYQFAKQLSDIHLSDIIDSVDGFDSFNACILGKHQCLLENPCAMHTIWKETKEKVLKTLTETTLDDIKTLSIESI